MVRHIVMLSLKDGTTAEERQTLLDGLASLPGAIDAISDFSFGTDIGVSDGNADVVAIAEFDDVAGYETYRDHPEHRKVIAERIAPVLASRTAIQYQL